ncbi:hypothetical protein ACWKSP_31115 [Micromonosporaceae bacterium Da 78-11]
MVVLLGLNERGFGLFNTDLAAQHGPDRFHPFPTVSVGTVPAISYSPARAGKLPGISGGQPAWTQVNLRR